MKKIDKHELKVEIIGSAEKAYKCLSKSEQEAFCSTLLNRITELYNESKKNDNNEK